MPKRLKVLSVRVTDDELSKIAKAASMAGRAASVWARQHLTSNAEPKAVTHGLPVYKLEDIGPDPLYVDNGALQQ